MKIRVISLFVLPSLLAGAAYGGPFGDEMAKCLVRSTTDADKSLFIQWIFAAISSHPDVKAMSNVSSEKGAELNRKTADLTVTLLTERCKSETGQALKYEGAQTFEAAFGVLGEVAMKGLMTDSTVSAFLAGLESYMDGEKINEAFPGAFQPNSTPRQP